MNDPKFDKIMVKEITVQTLLLAEKSEETNQLILEFINNIIKALPLNTKGGIIYDKEM